MIYDGESRGALGEWGREEFAQGYGDGGGIEVGEVAAAGRRASGGLEDAERRGEDGAGAHGIGRAEEREERDAEGVGEVHAAGVVGDEQAEGAEAAANSGSVVLPAAFSTRAPNPAAMAVVMGASLAVPRRTKRSGGERLDERAPMRDGPALGGGVFGAANQRDALIG